jgi:hypothetical protein
MFRWEVLRIDAQPVGLLRPDLQPRNRDCLDCCLIRCSGRDKDPKIPVRSCSDTVPPRMARTATRKPKTSKELLWRFATNRLNPSRILSPNSAPDGAIMSGSLDSATSAVSHLSPVSHPASSRHLLPQCLYHSQSGYASPSVATIFQVANGAATGLLVLARGAAGAIPACDPSPAERSRLQCLQ